MRKLAAALLCTVAWPALAQTAGAPTIPLGASTFTNNVWTGNNTWNGSATFNGTTTAPTQPLGDNTTKVATDAFVQSALAALSLNVKSYGASGSAATTTGTISAGSNQLALASALDFANGEGVRIPRAGSTFSIPQPTVVALDNGTTGSTTYNYYIASLDYAGGVGVPLLRSITNGPATISFTNYPSLAIQQGAAAAGVAIWRQIGTGAWVWLGNVTGNVTYNDRGFAEGSITRPDYIPADPTTITTALNDWFVAKVSSGGGTTTLTLSANVANAITAGPVIHSDTAAITAAYQAAATAGIGADIILPCGTYNIESTSANPIFNFAIPGINFHGLGDCSVINAWSLSTDFEFTGSSMSSLLAGGAFHDFYRPSFNKGLGLSLYVQFVNRFALYNDTVDHPPQGYSFFDDNDVRESHLRLYNVWQYGSIGKQFVSGAGSTEKGCCEYATDVYMQGTRAEGDLGVDKIGYYYNGFVATSYADGQAASNIAGKEYSIDNAVSNPTGGPQFLQFSKASAEDSNDTAIYINKGESIHFHDTTISDAGTPGNVVSNVHVSLGTSDIEFVGGRNSNASCNGFDMFGIKWRVADMGVYNNSATNNGGTTATCSGVVAEATAAEFVVKGLTTGNLDAVGWTQAFGIALVASSNHYVVEGNTLFGNNATTVSNPDGTGTTRVVTNNPS